MSLEIVKDEAGQELKGTSTSGFIRPETIEEDKTVADEVGLKEKLRKLLAEEGDFEDEKDVKSFRKNIAEVKEKVMDVMFKDHNVICEKLGYAIAALEDAASFLEEIIQGRENFLNPPPKVELLPEDVAMSHDYKTKLPMDLEDLRYMGEWFNKFLFVELRNLIKAKGAVEVQGVGNPETGAFEGIKFYFVPLTEDGTVDSTKELKEYPDTFKAGSELDLVKISEFFNS